jgi:glutathione S-transferase
MEGNHSNDFGSGAFDGGANAGTIHSTAMTGNNISNLSAGLRNIHIGANNEYVHQQQQQQQQQQEHQQQQEQHQHQFTQQQQQQNEDISELQAFFSGPSPTDGFSLITHRSAPNGFKIAIVLSELNYSYRTIHLDFNKNDHRLPQFLQLNPNGRVPVLIDHTALLPVPPTSSTLTTSTTNAFASSIPRHLQRNLSNTPLNKQSQFRQVPGNVSLWESGSIITYLCNKKLKEENECPAIWSDNLIEQSQILSWLFFQTSGHAPMIGQALHFRYFHSISVPSAIDRYTDEVRRVYGVLEMALSERREALIMELDSENAESYSTGLTPLSQSRYFDSPVWLVGDRCTIADLCFVPWNYVVDRIGIDLKAEFPEVYKWTKRMMLRPTVIRALTE